MKKNILTVVSFILIFIYGSDYAYCDNFSSADELVRKASTASSQEESYDYLHKAERYYLEEYNKNPTDIRALLGISKVNQMLQNRSEAKLYVLKAYNMKPDNPKLQKEMGDFYYSFQEYSTAVEYYKLALASGLLKDFETNLQTAKCYEKLGDKKNAELYYKISLHVNKKSREVLNKLNEYDSEKHPDNTQELENARYKYLFKDKKPTEQEQIEKDTNEIINNLNGE